MEKTKLPAKSREAGLDIIRVIATVLAMSYIAARCMRLVLYRLFRWIDRAKRGEFGT